VILLCNYSNIKDYVRPEPTNTDVEFWYVKDLYIDIISCFVSTYYKEML
jgi:hypothetical protein